MIEAEGTRVLSFVLDDGHEVDITPVFAAGKPVFLIGAHEQSHLRLSGASIAPAHAAVSLKDGDLYIQPRFPALEVLVNDRVITRPTRLELGDHVRIGDRLFILTRTTRTIAPLRTIQPALAETAVDTADVVIEDPVPSSARVHAPSADTSTRSRIPALVVAVIALVTMVGVGGYGVISRLNAASAVEAPTFAYYDGNATLVMFEADWCTYCAQQKPVVSELANEYRGDLYVSYVDIDNPENRGLVSRYGASSIPLMIVFNDQGEVIAALRGVTDVNVMRSAIDDALNASTGMRPT